jgi:ferritin-like protein
MPAELTDPDEFVQVAERASECRVKRTENVVKLKVRTPSRLYTIKLDPSKAEEVLKKIRCQIVEV